MNIWIIVGIGVLLLIVVLYFLFSGSNSTPPPGPPGVSSSPGGPGTATTTASTTQTAADDRQAYIDSLPSTIDQSQYSNLPNWAKAYFSVIVVNQPPVGDIILGYQKR